MISRVTVVLHAVVLCGARAGMYAQEKRVARDTEASAGSGFIYRTDGENPPVFIRLGEGKNTNFDAILEDFKREHGFYGVPPVVSGEPPSPHGIPVVGEADFGQGTLGYDPQDDGRIYETVLDEEPLTEFGRSAFDDDGYDNGFGASPPYKHHRDVSAADDPRALDDQNYFGSPYTHREHKSPGKHKSGGTFQKAGHYFSEGSLGDSGYKNHHEFDKGHAGKYGKDDLKSHYKKAGGHKSGHANEAGHYDKQHSTAHGAKGNKYGETESHKKGHKTTGYHNVYHKDEYNKEQMFYEDAHKHGKHDRYGGKHKDYTEKGKGHRHGHRYDSGFDEGHKGETGQFNKGGYYDGHKGHGVEAGHKSHHNHKAEYDQLSDNKKHGEHESGSGGYDFY